MPMLRRHAWRRRHSEGQNGSKSKLKYNVLIPFNYTQLQYIQLIAKQSIQLQYNPIYSISGAFRRNAGLDLKKGVC